MSNPIDASRPSHESLNQPTAERVISFGTCLRYLDMNLARLRNDVNNGIAPSIRYGVQRNGGYECVSVTAVSREPDLSQRMARVAKGNEYYETLFSEKESDEGPDFIPFAYVLDFRAIASQSNVKEIKQNWGYGMPGKGYEGLEQLISTPGQGNYWEGEVRIYFHEIMKQRGIDLNACRGLVIRERDLDTVTSWIQQLKSEGLKFPNVPIFSSKGERFLGNA